MKDDALARNSERGRTSSLGRILAISTSEELVVMYARMYATTYGLQAMNGTTSVADFPGIP